MTRGFRRIRFDPWTNDCSTLWACRSSRHGDCVMTSAVRCFGRVASKGFWLISNGNCPWDIAILEEKDLGPGELVAIVAAGSFKDAMNTNLVRENVKSLHSRKPVPKGIRYAVLHRDGFRCRYCGASPADDGVVLHVDHIIPASHGGRDDESNLATSCQACNLGKGNRFHGHPPRQAGRPDPGEAARR